MPEAFENPEGLFFGNMNSFVVGFEISIYENLFLSSKK
jgi:hypothetical protein